MIPSSSLIITEDGKRATGLSVATMRKLMKMRQVKRSLPEEKEKNDLSGMELPSDTFVKETADRLPFIAEIEDDEKSVAVSSNTSSNVHQKDFAVETDDDDGKEFNIPTTSGMTVNSDESPVIEETERCKTATNHAIVIAHEIPQHLKQYAVSDEKQPSTTKDDKSLKRKRTRIRDVTLSKQQKVLYY
ncbi:unnamed protein product [Onchocerca ochengi]|uniref:Uncharacterized protein n=1 Tax=Onchocerca ochengi TaxID=42157 RepID=A0A182EMU2_ONCOC|nr:unnamed protein product [Onchocerca ochengi]